ncbi:RES family NAD+ phosphorylase [Novosphingobium sp. 1949]|uniref:RES family NAD+ phosphorylase n=1 Tax=Novosphingobium organovorum TaxID=2930092 RepID=A0ABT0BG99_9SPHN|nr:RES family NAD+ phosphorylase [Novosphingobium organovorum]MCJ2183888.1 RES family NAD+ phosphorylase [Novosphingobium organovorum]
MKLWRLVRADRAALDGAGARLHGGRYFSAGHAIVSLASEPGLAVLIAARYWLAGRDLASRDRVSGDPAGPGYALGWTEVDAEAERLGGDLDSDFEGTRRKGEVDRWVASRRSLLLALRSAVLPEADVVLLNAEHPQAARVAPLTLRPFRFEDCLHRPPMYDAFRAGED